MLVAERHGSLHKTNKNVKVVHLWFIIHICQQVQQTIAHGPNPVH